PACARPVRILPRSVFSASIDFAIRASASFLIWSSVCGMASPLKQGTLGFPAQNAQHRPGLIHIKDTHGQILIPAERDGGRVHDAYALGQGLIVADLVVTFGVRVLHRVAV